MLEKLLFPNSSKLQIQLYLSQDIQGRSCLSSVQVYKKMIQHNYMWEKVAYLIDILMSAPNKELRYVVSAVSKKKTVIN